MIELRSSGDANRNRIIVGGSALVLVVAIGLLVWSLTGGDSVSTGPPEYHFLCEKCGHHFIRQMTELPANFAEERLKPDGQAGIDCPKCGAKNAAYVPFKCRNPDCAKYYLTPWSKHPAGPSQQEFARGEKWDTKCPHCGTDPAEWDRKHKGK